MRIAVLSKSDARGGGASRVAGELVAGLNAADHQATHFVGLSSAGFTAARRPLYGPQPLRAATRLGHVGLRRLGLGDGLPLELPAVALAGIARHFDLVHVHDLGAAIAPQTLAWLARRLPVFWTLHDCSAFTGGCLYPMGCERFRAACGACPQHGAWPLDGLFDLTARGLRAKAALHAPGRVTTIAPSRWMADLAWSSGWLAARPLMVANGVDTDLFRPAPDRAKLRRALGVPEDRPVVLLSAGWLHERRKGLAHAIAAVRAVADLDLLVLLVGDDDGHLPAALAGIAHHATGYVSDPATLARWYAAADVFLFCSLADNQPLAVLEAMACATPVVGFATGGIPEIVPAGTGALVPPGDDAGLATALRAALAPGVAQGWGQAARAHVAAEFAMPGFVERHLAAYRAGR